MCRISLEDVVRAKDETVTYLRRPHGGAAAAKNAGINMARGEFVAFLDADDLWHPDKLARQMTRLVERSEIDLCFTAYRNFWAPELSEEAQEYQGRALSLPSSGWSMSTLLTYRNVFQRFGLFEECATEKHQSLIWVLHAAKQGANVDVLPDILMQRRLHSSNQSRGWAIDEEFFELVKAWRDYCSARTEADDAL